MFEWFKRQDFTSKLTIMLLVTITFLGFITGCATPTKQDGSIPEKIQAWAETNTWSIEDGVGSGWWYGNTMITNCHVVGGMDKVVAENNDRSIVLPLKVKACDEERDLAILVYESGDLPFTPLPTILAKPEKGQVLYGAGYPVGASLTITQGHYQGHDIRWAETFLITTLTIFGDSGSSATYLDKNGRVVVAGVRSAVRAIPSGYSNYYITHLTLMVDSATILEFLGENA